MAIELELYRSIRRLYNEGLSQRKIAQILSCSRKTVTKYCQGEILYDAKSASPEVESPLRHALEKEIVDMLQENKTLPRKQQRTAKAIWQELKKKGFQIGESTVRRYVQNLCLKHPEAFVPLYFEPGEAMQVDWGDMKAWIGEVNTPVSVFVTILPYSYGLYASVFPDKKNTSFMSGHVRAFDFFGGVARRGIYDNLRSAVASGSGKTAVKAEEFKGLEAHYGFESDFCNVAAGWEKGGVENAVALIRRIAFTPMPRVRDFTELQQHVDACCLLGKKWH
jgi:transposase